MSEAETYSHTIASLPPGFTTLDQLEQSAGRERKISRVAILSGAATLLAGVWEIRKGNTNSRSHLLELGAIATTMGIAGLLESREHQEAAYIIRRAEEDGAELIPNP